MVDPTAPGLASGKNVGKGLPCAKDGNAVAYNGFVVRDRSGAVIGVIHDATVSADQKLVTVRVQTAGASCYRISNAAFKFREGEVWADVDGAAFR